MMDEGLVDRAFTMLLTAIENAPANGSIGIMLYYNGTGLVRIEEKRTICTNDILLQESSDAYDAD